MFKNIPIKIVLVFFLIGIIIIGGFCGFFLNSLNIISQKIQVEQNLDIGQVTDMINQLENNTKVAVIIFSIAYIIVGIIIAVILSKFIRVNWQMKHYCSNVTCLLISLSRPH